MLEDIIPLSDDVNVDQARRMIIHLSFKIDAHHTLCKECYNDATHKTCYFCKQLTRLLYLQGIYMDRIREHERDTIRALD